MSLERPRQGLEPARTRTEPVPPTVGVVPPTGSARQPTVGERRDLEPSTVGARLSPGWGFMPRRHPRAHNWPRTTIIQRPEPAPQNPVKTCQPVTPERAARAESQYLSQKALHHNVHYVKLARLGAVSWTGRGGALAFVQAGPSERLSSQPPVFSSHFELCPDKRTGLTLGTCQPVRSGSSLPPVGRGHFLVVAQRVMVLRQGDRRAGWDRRVGSEPWRRPRAEDLRTGQRVYVERRIRERRQA